MILSQEETQPLTAGSTPSVVLPKRSSGGGKSSSSGSGTTTKTTPNASHVIQIPTITTTANNTAAAIATNFNTNSNASSGSPAYSDLPVRDKVIFNVIFSLIVLVVWLGICFVIRWAILTDDSNKTLEFRVDSVSISPFNTVNYQTRSYNDWNMNIGFVAKNPKKETTLYYDMIHASLFYEKALLSETSIGAFYQGVGQQTVINATFTTSSEVTGAENWVAAAIDGYRIQGKALKFNVLVQARATLNPGSKSYEEENWLKVNCRDIKVQFLSRPTAVAKSCDVFLNKDDY